MGMRETEKSLRNYFVIAGFIAVALGLQDLSEILKLPFALPATWMLALWFPTLARMVLGVCFVMSGFKLSTALTTGARGIQGLLLAALGVMVIDAVLIAGVIGVDLGQSGLIGSFIGLLIIAYLLANVRRLSTEAMAKSVPPAQVV